MSGEAVLAAVAVTVALAALVLWWHSSLQTSRMLAEAAAIVAYGEAEPGNL